MGRSVPVSLTFPYDATDLVGSEAPRAAFLPKFDARIARWTDEELGAAG